MKLSQNIMGMPITIEVIGDDISASELITKAFEEFHWTDETFSTYKPSSEISQLNSGRLSLDTVSPIVREVLATCEDLKSTTSGYFDISHNGSIDPSGYVKGWSIGRVAKILRAGGAENFVVNAGGDMVCAGKRGDGKPWVIGIANPTNPKQSIKQLALSNASIATSALYERGEHIYNPLTGDSATGFLSVSVVGPDIVTADVYATTVFAMGPVGISWIAEKSDYAAYIVTIDNHALYTPNFASFLAN